MITVVRELESIPGSAIRGPVVACLVTDGKSFWRVSSVTVLGRPETLVFPANEAGDVTSWGEVAGGPYYSREEAIVDLEEVIT